MREKNLLPQEREDPPKGLKPLQHDPRMALDLSEIGERGSYFFLTHSSRYVKRQVETLQIKSASFGRRRLTLDIQLPPDKDLGKSVGDDEYEYWVPVTALTKQPRSNIDLCDDNGCAIPLLTRTENIRISLAAVLAGAKELLAERRRTPPTAFLRALLEETVKRDELEGEVPMALARWALEKEGVDLGGEKGEAFADTLRILAGNYAMWVRLQGRPGDRKVVKFRYDTELERQGLLRQRLKRRRYLIFGRETGAVYPLTLEEQGDANPYSPIRRMMARIASSTGLGAVNVGIESTYIAGSDTYHLQVESPPGVEARDINLLASLEGDSTFNHSGWKRDHGAHLYVGGARRVEDGISPALLTLRIGRRGFMTLAWLSVLLSATLLWLFDVSAPTVRFGSPEAIVAVLLLGPALLAALVVRPDEHPVTTKLFSGVRLLVALNGILAVAAAAAVSGIRPEGWTAEHSWFIYAICASASAAVVSLSWVFSWDISYSLVKFLRWQLSTGKKYRRPSVWLLGLSAVLLLLGSAAAPLGVPPATYVVPVAAVIAGCGFVSAGYAGLPRSSALAAVAVTFTFLACLGGMAVLIMHLASGWSWADDWRVLAAVPLSGLLLLALNAIRVRRKRTKSSSTFGRLRSGVEDLRAGLPEAPPWLLQTPSGTQMRKQARKNATGVPDLVAPSAYREVELAKELEDSAEQRFTKFQGAFTRSHARRGSGDRTSADTEEQKQERQLDEEQKAKRLGCEFVCLDGL